MGEKKGRKGREENENVRNTQREGRTSCFLITSEWKMDGGLVFCMAGFFFFYSTFLFIGDLIWPS